MQKLFDFNLNKEQDSHKNCLNLKSFIDKIVEEDLKLVVEKQSNILGLPSKVASKKLKAIIYNKFNFETGKFSVNNKLLNIFSGYLINIFFIFYIFIFRKKIKNFEERDIILDGVDAEDELYRFKPLFSKFKNSYFIKNDNFKFYRNIIPNSKSINFYGNPINPEFLKKKIFYYIKFLNFLMNLSLKKKFNYFYFINIIFFVSLRSESIFYNYRSKFKINDRFYYSCPIKDYIFKKHGGKLSVCTQIHLPESSISFFTNTDVLFTLGNEQFSKKKLLDLGGEITDTFPAGSLKMEHHLFNNDKSINNENYKSDVLIIGINVHRWIQTSNSIKKNYYNFIEWIGMLSKKFPNLKIVYKHHANSKKDINEIKILQNTNVEIILNTKPVKNNYYYLKNLSFVKKFNKFFTNIIYRKDTNNLSSFYSSYFFLQNSKLIFSFGSSMILEARGLNKQAYFLDPKFENSGFFGQLEYLKNIRISNFETLEKIVLEKINNNKISNDIFCLPSNDTSEKIFNFLKKF